jgi:hypothetical protein
VNARALDVLSAPKATELLRRTGTTRRANSPRSPAPGASHGESLRLLNPERRESDLSQADHHFTVVMSSSFHVLSNSGF